MGELSDAYAFIDRNMVVDRLHEKSVFRAAELEAAVKSYLAGRDGLDVKARELNENYEISMRLRPRKEPLKSAGLEILEKLESSGSLLDPDTRAKLTC